MLLIKMGVYNYLPVLCVYQFATPHNHGRNIQYAYSSVIRGHHAYKETWMSFIGEELTTNVEVDDLYDQHTVAILKNREVVGHVPCVIAWFTACTTTQFTHVQSLGLLLLLA